MPIWLNGTVLLFGFGVNSLELNTEGPGTPPILHGLADGTLV